MATFAIAQEVALQFALKKLVQAAIAANQQVVDAGHPSSVSRTVDGAEATDDAIRFTSNIIYKYVYMLEIVAFAMQTLKDLSPVGGASDPHAGLYRDSHLLFIDGAYAPDASAWLPGKQIEISNPVPYSRIIELGNGRMRAPLHVYEQAAPIISGKYGNSVNVKFDFLPVRFGSIQAYAGSRAGQAAMRRRGGSQRALRDWISRQPCIIITSR